ncbi:uracil-DNA glycosylase [Sulfurimonas autotrophica]|uniref:Uracil-DNA glycosylase n=1 Tax=Sulfurimonas autotrophica (strain ATCC BAA-671 / DSM 16294 / JCM 11897 / OK10) TaxID=563040 RepID=E0UQG7_SULAO|nr:uracil-DNA glycosylase [Sulfurimonas autotrophica]ADN08769.1 Uracil-DNA glycosylase [Sulfurimonas autotrophica DSM 16294]
MIILDDEWKKFLSDEIHKEYFIELMKKVSLEYESRTVFPSYKNIFRAFNLVNPSEVKVIIIGQDPYHGMNQANGLAFSVCDRCKIPPSLRNIYKELVDDLGCKYPKSGNLTQWTAEGVLLINAVLTVEKGQANSHKEFGWQKFTDAVIKKLSDEKTNLVFILWGAPSQKKESFIDTKKHFVVKSAHPSPLSAYRGFFGSKPFSKTNEYLIAQKKKPINWCLDAEQTLL